MARARDAFIGNTIGLVSIQKISYPADLPVSARRSEILEAIKNNQVVVIAGATGSGKTTQIPKMCLELGRNSIAHTQPRRIAARAVAERIAEELKVELGDLVGYQVRFTDQSSAKTKVKVMTDGILLNAMQRNRKLEQYDTIIIDEAHERSLNIDFLLGYLKQLLPKRPDLKLIITSATIDPESFSKHFEGAPIIEVSGRTYPIEVRYRPIKQDEEDNPDPDASTTARDYIDGIASALDELALEPDGDVLVFLSGESEIRDAQEVIQGGITAGDLGKGIEVLPLYGRLSSAEQHRVFETSKVAGLRRRIILATNVAETSLTIPNIKYVIDSGTARISRYSPAAKVQRLPIEAISKASADQRAGRAGRTSPGVVIRLYSEDEYEAKAEFTDPEILRTNLASVILQAAQLGLGDITKFPFLQAPDPRGVRDGLSLLAELGCLKDSKSKEVELTGVGKALARLPIEPRFGRMLLESKKHDLVREVMIIVAGLTIQDPRERPVIKRVQADAAHARFADPTSDFLSLLNLWNYIETNQKKLSSSAFRRLCKGEFLNYLRVREWQDLVRQITSIAKPLELIPGQPKVDPDGIHKSLLSGLLSQIGLRQLSEKKAGDVAKKSDKPAKASNEYLGSNAKKFVIFPGSSLAKKPPAAVMSAELVETSRVFARMNAAINPEWAEALAGDLVKRSFSEPHWEKSQGSVVAYERVMLFGVPIVVSRRMQYSRLDMKLCRELFIRHALVQGEWDSIKAFDKANRELLKKLEDVAANSKKPQYTPDEDDVFRFYDARIPAEVVSTRSFEGWWRKAERETPNLLTMTREDLLPQETEKRIDLPSQWIFGEQSYKLEYKYHPGEIEDGLTVLIPLADLPNTSRDAFDWLVPELRTELIAELIRTLPKNIRKYVVPAADWSKKALATLPDNPTEPILETVAKTLRTLSGTHMLPTDFKLEQLPTSLRMTYKATSESGEALGVSLSLDELKQKFAPQTTTPESSDAKSLASDSDYLKLKDQFVSDVISRVASPVSAFSEGLSKEDKLVILAAGYRNVQDFVDDVVTAVIEGELEGKAILSLNAGEIAVQVSQGLLEECSRCLSLIAEIVSVSREASKAISQLQDISLLFVLANQKKHVASLLPKKLISTTGINQLIRLTVYLKANLLRTSKLLEDLERDRRLEIELNQAILLFENAGGVVPLKAGMPENIVKARWALEEFRVSLFAQQLGTAEPVSLDRIKKILNSK
ncbi:MAG: ATP-dependent RNA helicase HrpA [Micrococcales bacterium]|nr:ATP-dependent RNA helicase HrpA [Microbacteriaceae bacterium]NBR22437.1 ATP-dependent RNA helicase HrpA [Micrococcales bacterium]NBX94982.1 ATP-dependent RNA helicase HrpA [Actinomycetota bacterium]